MIGAAILMSGAASQSTLRAAGYRRNIFVGSQFAWPEINNASFPEYKSKHAEQYALSTVGNQCKWASTHPERSTFTLQNCIDALKYAHGANQKFRGHNLCWGNNNPEWLLNGKWTQEELRELLENHISTVMKGVNVDGNVRPFVWDVVNEACASQEEYEATGNSSYFKRNFWYPALPDYVDIAFTTARKADPNAQLFYNDYGQSQETGKAEVVYDMVASMVKRNIPLDGVGMQQHLDVRLVFDVDTFEKHLAFNIARLVQLGLNVHITELDVKCGEPCSEADLQKQADIYAAVLRACLTFAPPSLNSTAPGCKSFETWGFTDAVSWLNGRRCKPMGPCHPLPWDEHLKPKPALTAILQVLETNATSLTPHRHPAANL